MSLSAGVHLGPYEILSRLGAGGMGEVYRARDTKLNRDVAIKSVSDEIADAASLRRFQQEAQTASSLNHPHILTVFDVGEWDGRHYLVTELIDGGTLKDWANAERRTWRQVVDLLIGVADGLAAAHASSILHRDIKPDNILVTRNGYAKLADFGLAKLVSDVGDAQTRTVAAPATRRGVIVGTIAYMSPEQATGKTLDARSDIFSFGVVLHELLSGRRPFAGASDLALLQAIVHETPTPLGDDIPWGLRSLVEKALEKDPADRYQTTSDLVVDLRRLARGRGSAPARPVTAAARANWWPWAAIAGITAFGAAALAFAIVGRPAATPDSPLATAQFSRLTDFEGAELDAAISPDGKFVVFLADRDGPFDLFLTRVGSGAFTKLTHGDLNLRQTLRSAGFSSDGSEIWLQDFDQDSPVRIMPLMGGRPRVFLGNGSREVAWSPDGERIVYHTSDPGDPVFVADRTSGNAHQILVDSADRHNHFPVWSSDGKWIYVVRGIPAANQMDLWRISPAGGQPERVTEHNGYVGYPAPIDARTVLYVAQDAYGAGPWLWAVDVPSKVSRRVSSGLEQYASVAASADGRRLVATVANPTANLWSIPILDRPAGDSDVRPFPVPTVRALAPRFGGASLFYLSSAGSGDGLWRFQGGQTQEVWKGADGALLEPPAVSLDGHRVAFVLRRHGARRLQVATADGTEPHAADDTLDVQGTASWSPDGNWIVAGGTDPRGPGLFKIPVGGGPGVRLVSGTALNPVWSPSGGVIVYSGANVGTEAPLLAVDPDGARVELPAVAVPRGERFRFLPDGTGLVFMRGSISSQDFWLLDLSTRKTRALTHLDPNARAVMRTFDITPDGKRIVFDRLRDNSDIVLIDRPK